MNDVIQLRGLYAEYLAKVEELVARMKPGDGLLGMGSGPKDAPCHEWFDQQVEALVSGVEENAAKVAELLLRGEKDHQAPLCAQWMLIAVQRHALKLIGRLDAAQAKRLLDWYTQAYSVFHRLPIQREIVKRLKERVRA